MFNSLVSVNMWKEETTFEHLNWNQSLSIVYIYIISAQTVLTSCLFSLFEICHSFCSIWLPDRTENRWDSAVLTSDFSAKQQVII